MVISSHPQVMDEKLRAERKSWPNKENSISQGANEFSSSNHRTFFILSKLCLESIALFPFKQ